MSFAGTYTIRESGGHRVRTTKQISDSSTLLQIESKKTMLQAFLYNSRNVEGSRKKKVTFAT
jgi:hypothetical protein